MRTYEALGTSYYPLAEIPETRSMDGWKNIPIHESGEGLICLNDLVSERITVNAGYFNQRISNTSDRILLREAAAIKLIKASRQLSYGLSLVLFDGYRPFAVQVDIFERFKSKLRTERPELDEATLIAATEKYVSLPSMDDTKPSPHSTGGAIDLSIIKTGNGKLLEMGSDWDSFEAPSQTGYYKSTQPLFHYNRQLLYEIMTSAGFTNYPEEWWHYDYGNQFWGHLSGMTAIYGIVN